MGEDIPTGCPHCCDELPDSLSMSIVVPDVSTFSGTVSKTNGCTFGGPLQGEPPFGQTPGIATFCANGGNDLEMASAGPILAQCGGVIIENNHCSLPAVMVSAGGCTYTISL